MVLIQLNSHITLQLTFIVLFYYRLMLPTQEQQKLHRDKFVG